MHQRPEQLHELEVLRLSLPNKTSGYNAVLLRLVDAEGKEVRQVISQTPEQRETARFRAEPIMEQLKAFDENERLAIIAELLTGNPSITE